MTNRLSPANLISRSAAFAHALTARLPVHPLSPFRQRRSGVTSALKPASLLLAAAVLLAILAVDAGSISTAEAQDATITSLLSRLDVRVVSSGATTQNAGYDAAKSQGSLSPAGFNYPAGFGPWYMVEALAVNQGTTSNPTSVVISVRGTVTSVASSGTHRAHVLPSGASITLHLEGENFSKSYSLKNPNGRTVTKCVDVDQEGNETERHCRVGETTTEEYDWTTNLPPRLANGDKVIVRLRYSAPRPGKPGTPTVTAPTGKSGALVVEWTVPMIPDPDSMDESDMIPDPKVRGYEVHVSPAAGETEATGVTRTTGGSTTRLPVLLLDPDTAYNVRVRARTYLASGPWSDTATAMTNPLQGANNPQVELDLNDVTEVKQGDSLPLRLKVTGMPNLHAGAFPRQFEGHNQSHDVEFRVLGGIAEWYEFKDGGGGCGGGAFYGGGLTIGEDGEVYHDFGSLMIPDNKSDYGPLYIWLGSGCGAQPRSQFSIGSTANSRATALCVEVADSSNNVPTGRTCSTEGSAGHAGDRLTGRFVNVPQSHDGENEFNFRLAFVEDVGISPTSLREDALTATGGAVTQVQRVDDRSDLFKITVEPDSDEDVTITLSSSGDCGEAGSICTQEEDPRKLDNSPTATVAGPILTASFQGLPSQHDGETAFSFRIAFSDEIATDAAEFRDHSVEVWGGEVTRAEPVGQRRDLWEVEVEPASEDMVMVSLKLTQSCAATGAVCTAGGRLLSVVPATMVPGPATWPVRVTGEARVGKTLTADSSNLSERYGVQVTSMTYRWLADGARIPGAIGRTYQPDDDQQGKRISVMATYTDDRGNEETVISAPTEPLAARDRIRRATGLPLISGRALVGHTLTADTSLIIDPNGLENAVFHYFWEADDDSIPDATDPTYTPVEADVGKEITVIVAWVDDAGHGQNMTSQPTMPVMTAEAAAAVEFRKSLRVAANADGSVTLYWNAPDDEVTGYRILRHRNSLGELDPLVYLADTGSTATAYTDTGMVAGVPHNYRVQAIRDGVLGERTIQIRIFPVRKATNSPATGAPSISGTAQVGETLTADISGIADEDGLENVTRNYLWAAVDSSGKIGARYAYQWLVDGADSGSGDHHAGYDNTTYTLTEDDVSKAISVRVTFVDDGGHQETLTSLATDLVAALPQPNSPATGAPTIGGTAQVGETLTADTSGITDEDGLDDSTFTVQWITDDSVMVASAARSYTPTGGDRGKAIKVRVSFTDDAGNRETRTSTQTAPIEGQANGQEGNSPATGAPVISGTAQVGETLTADTTGIADADGLTNVSFSYQWIRNDGTTDTDIQGATSSTYTLSDADEGKTIKVRVSFTDKGGYQETLTSTTTIIVDQPGTVSLWPEQPRVGTVVSATLTDSDGLEGSGSGAAASLGAVSWQWARSSEGSTWTSVDVYEDGDSYTPAEDDEGMWLKVTAVYTDGHGKGKSAEAITAATVGAREASPELTVTELVTGLTHPWDIAFTPDGTMLFTERDDGLRVRLTDGTVRQVTADFSDLNFGGTAGLLALVLDPDFVPNRRFYTYQRHTGAEMQVIAWTIDQDYIAAARVADPLVGGIPRNRNRGPSHGGGRLRFGPQGYLWIATGDGFSGTTAQDLTSLGGKVLRVDSQTGAGAPDNPFAPSPIYTYGHRNPQGLALRPGTGQMWSVEHGPDHDDEINLLVSGGNYGWDPAPDEGAEDLYDETTTPMTDLVKFPDGLEAKWSSGYPPLAVGGGVFLEGSQWREWEGRFAVATLKTKSVRVFKFTEEGDLVSQAVVPELDHTYGRLRTAVLGPDGALYITTTNGGSKDKILKVVPANTPATGLPTIDGTPQVGETLTVSTSSITDTDGMDSATFSYQWIANDGTTGADIEDATDSTYELSDDDVERTITVRVTFTDGGGNEETLTSAPTGPVLGDGPPGAPVNLAATAGNKEVTLSWDPPADNGNAPATGYRIEWRVDGKDYDKNLWGTARSTTYTTNDQANLANGVKYFFRVKAGNGSGYSYGPYGPASGEVSATPTSGSAADLGTPVMLDTENLHHGMVQLDWQDIEDAGWYVVQYYHVKGGEWLDLPAEGVDIALHGSSAVVSNLHGLSWLRVRAMSCAGASEWSQIEQLFGTNASDWEGVPVPEVEAGDEIEPCPVVLGTPVLSETETLHHGMVRLDWEDIEDAGWYVVQHYHVKGGEWLDLPAEGVDIAFHGSSAVVSNLHGLSWLRVRAMSCAGESEWSQIEQLFGTNASDWEGVPVPEVAEGDEIEPCSEDTDTPDNSPATGAPTISGTAQVGETLTANTSGIADADGLSSVQYEYQWLADDTDISGATNATYTLTDSEESKAITVQVSFTDDADNKETLTSAATDAVAAAPQTNSPATGAPTIAGTSQVGQTLTADTSGIADADGLANATFSYQWLADDTEIAGATGLTYTLIDSEESKAITVQVSFTDDRGHQETLTSAATEAVSAAPTPNSPATGAPAIGGTAQVGETLTANTSGIADADGLSNVQYEYQWFADDAEIAGATGLTYTLADADEGKAIKVEVSFTDDADNEESLTSAATAVVAAEPSEPPDKPKGLEATASHGQVVLTWDNPQDDSITGYVILRRVRENDEGGEFSELVADTGTAATTYTDAMVAASTTYTYRIKAINGVGTSERSRWVHIDTPAPPVPDKPTGLSATAAHDAITLTWDNPGDDSITGYVILRRNRDDDPKGHFDELVADTGSAATTYTDDTVEANTNYTYRIKAINEHGVSQRSRWRHISTPAAP